MPRDGSKNLKSLADRTIEEQRQIAIAGGVASGKTRKKQKTLREMFELFGESKPNKVVLKTFADLGIPVEEDDTMLTCMFKWAGVKSFAKGTKMGDLLKFFEIFGKYTGQEPAKEVNLGGEISSKVKYITPDSIDEIKKHIADTIKDV